MNAETSALDDSFASPLKEEWVVRHSYSAYAVGLVSRRTPKTVIVRECWLSDKPSVRASRWRPDDVLASFPSIAEARKAIGEAKTIGAAHDDLVAKARKEWERALGAQRAAVKGFWGGGAKQPSTTEPSSSPG